MKSSFRWYGEDDPVTLDKIRQIPGMRSVVSAVYDVKPGTGLAGRKHPPSVRTVQTAWPGV